MSQLIRKSRNSLLKKRKLIKKRKKNPTAEEKFLM